MKTIYLVSSLLAFVLAFFTLTGDLQTLIHFQDPLNEIAFFTLCLASGAIGFYLMLSEPKRAIPQTGGLTGTTQSWIQDPEVGADHWEEYQKLMESLHKEKR